MVAPQIAGRNRIRSESDSCPAAAGVEGGLSSGEGGGVAVGPPVAAPGAADTEDGFNGTVGTGKVSFQVSASKVLADTRTKNKVFFF